jgi:L-threonylcarbamoyladenylate synthase
MSMPAAAEIARAAAILRDGGLVAFPTETVYGLGANARDPVAAGRIFAAKGRPPDHPLIVHIAGPDQLARWASHVPDAARRLAEAFWPGPLAMVLPRRDDVPDAVTGGLDTVALRMPAHPVALALLREFGGGIAAPSANRYGRVSPTRAEHVRAELGASVDLVLDGGDCDVGIESTLVDVSGEVPVLLRPGAIDVARIAAVLGVMPRAPDTRTAPAPGRAASHYAPRARVVLASSGRAPTQAVRMLESGLRVGLLSTAPPSDARLAWLRWPVDSATRARRLYALLREADALGLDAVVATLPSGDGLSAALRDRLVRAAGQGDGRRDAGHAREGDPPRA